MLEDFKNIFRGTQAYKKATVEIFDEEILEVNDKGVFVHPLVREYFSVYAAACKRAAGLAIAATAIPPNAENPTRDHIVILGEEISEAILK